MVKVNVFISVALVFTLHVYYSKCDTHIYVSPQGLDANDGLKDSSPVKTLQHAVNLAGDKKYKNETVIIELMQGYHDLTRTLYIGRDNATVIRSYKHQEVHVTGGLRIPSSLLKPVTDNAVLSRLPANARPHVRVVDLHDMNITNYGKMEYYGSNARRNDQLEVFYNGQPLHLAKYPNKGYLNIVDNPDGQQGLRFRYNSTRPQSWHAESEPWVYGYWYAGWTDGAVKVASVDAKNMIATLVKKPPHGIRKGNLEEFYNGISNHDGGYFRFINIFSELDEPGEYYMDRSTGNLYMWVPNSNGNIRSSDIVYISMIQDCLWITKSDVRLEDFTIESCRKRGVVTTGHYRTVLRHLEVRNTGSFGIRFAGDVRDSSVSQCYVHDTSGGIFISGGNRKTLESSGNIAENNEITRYDRVFAVGNEGLQLWDEGTIARNNHIYDGQTGAIYYIGNDMKMEYNLIHHVCQGSSSCNAIRTGYDWTMRGHLIQYNIIHNVLQLYPGGTNRAILLDGQASGTTIQYNAFANKMCLATTLMHPITTERNQVWFTLKSLYVRDGFNKVKVELKTEEIAPYGDVVEDTCSNNTCHVFIGGGRYNIVNNNVMYNATVASIHVDSRGVSANGYAGFVQKLHNMPYHNATWALRYPHLADIDNHNASLPEGNQIVKNVMYMHAGPNADYIKGLNTFLMTNLSRYFNITQTGFSIGAIDHFNVPNADLRLQCYVNRWANKVNFRQPPSPNSVGPMHAPVGPIYLNRGRVHLVNLTRVSTNCTTQPPADSPLSSYLPDGAAGNNLYQVGHSGCWLNVTRCTNHAASVGTYRDMYGERYRNAADNETMCFRQAVEQWQFCGSHKYETVVAIYAPTGSASIGGEGCMMATYGCPKHGGPADGHRNLTSGHYQFIGQGQPGEAGCLRRAHEIWTYCGYSPNYPVTAVWLPTGAKRTVGAGCWISLKHCSTHNHRNLKGLFHDAVGASNYFTDDFEFACLHRAEYYWHLCGSKPQYPVTAEYRPTSAVQTYPEPKLT